MMKVWNSPAAEASLRSEGYDYEARLRGLGVDVVVILVVFIMQMGGWGFAPPFAKTNSPVGG
jgi:hypothetical protein